MICLLHRIDPDQNMARFYRIEVMGDLFGAVTVERCWGRIGARGQRHVASYPSRDEAEHHAERLIRTKARRGYVPAV